MYTLCNRIVERIVVEVEYLKPIHGLPLPCSFDRMRKALVGMGYEAFDLSETQSLTNADLSELPPDIVFRLRSDARPPADQLRGAWSNPCAMFDMG